MTAVSLAKRMDGIEDIMEQLAYQTLQTQQGLDTLTREMRELKDGMREFKDEMSSFKEDMGRKWGELARKMGTLVEDIVAPNLPEVARELFGCGEPEFFAVRVRRYLGGRLREDDVLLVCPRLVLVNETKSSLGPEDVKDFVKDLAKFRDFYPEYAGRRVVGVLASLYVDETPVRAATRRKLLVMGMAAGTMRVLNPEVVDDGRQ
jgi:hypothetical protein